MRVQALCAIVLAAACPALGATAPVTPRELQHMSPEQVHAAAKTSGDMSSVMLKALQLMDNQVDGFLQHQRQANLHVAVAKSAHAAAGLPVHTAAMQELKQQQLNAGIDMLQEMQRHMRDLDVVSKRAQGQEAKLSSAVADVRAHMVLSNAKARAAKAAQGELQETVQGLLAHNHPEVKGSMAMPKFVQPTPEQLEARRLLAADRQQIGELSTENDKMKRARSAEGDSAEEAQERNNYLTHETVRLSGLLDGEAKSMKRAQWDKEQVAGTLQRLLSQETAQRVQGAMKELSDRKEELTTRYDAKFAVFSTKNANLRRGNQDLRDEETAAQAALQSVTEENHKMNAQVTEATKAVSALKFDTEQLENTMRMLVHSNKK